MTHHIELALPAAKYLVAMRDGRIQIQGTISDLRSRGELSNIIGVTESHNKALTTQTGRPEPPNTRLPFNRTKFPSQHPPLNQPSVNSPIAASVYKIYLRAS